MNSHFWGLLALLLVGSLFLVDDYAPARPTASQLWSKASSAHSILMAHVDPGAMLWLDLVGQAQQARCPTLSMPQGQEHAMLWLPG